LVIYVPSFLYYSTWQYLYKEFYHGWARSANRKESENVVPKTNLAQSITKRRMDYLCGMLAGGRAQNHKEASELAPKFGVTEKTIQNWFKKPETMNVATFYRMCDELGLTISVQFKDIPE
jgi:DNA-binding XRE family transcriptional regulator